MELDHVVLECADPLAEVSFCHEVLGLEPVRLEEFQSGEAPFVSARVSAGLILDFFPPGLWATPGQAHNPNHLCFTTTAERAAKIRATLNARGIAIERESDHNFGARGWGVVYYFRSPGGIMLEVRHYP